MINYVCVRVCIRMYVYVCTYVWMCMYVRVSCVRVRTA